MDFQRCPKSYFMKFFSILVMTYLLSSCSLVTNSRTYSRTPNSFEVNLSCKDATRSFNSFKNAESLLHFQELLEKYQSFSREEITLLSQDAAHGNIIDTRSIQEADSMLHALSNGLIPDPLKRDGAVIPRCQEPRVRILHF